MIKAIPDKAAAVVIKTDGLNAKVTTLSGENVPCFSVDIRMRVDEIITATLVVPCEVEVTAMAELYTYFQGSRYKLVKVDHG